MPFSFHSHTSFYVILQIDIFFALTYTNTISNSGNNSIYFHTESVPYNSSLCTKGGKILWKLY